MLTEPTLEKLKALRLDAFAAAWLAQQQDSALAAVPFDERLGLLVEAEWLARENRRLPPALREAKLRLSQACVEDIDYAPRRGLHKGPPPPPAPRPLGAGHPKNLVNGENRPRETDLARGP